MAQTRGGTAVADPPEQTQTPPPAASPNGQPDPAPAGGPADGDPGGGAPGATDGGGEPAGSSQTEGGAAAQAARPSWRELLPTLSPAERRELFGEIRRDPGVAGVIGGEIQEAARGLATRQAQQLQQMQRRQGWREKARNNPSEFAQEWLSADEQQEQQEQTSELETRYVNQGKEAARLTLAAWQKTLPEEVQAAVRSKVYDGMTWEQGYTAYVNDVVEALAAHRTKTNEQATRARLEAELRPVIETEVRQAIASGRPPVDGSGGQSGAGVLTQAVFDANRGNPDWVNQNLDRIGEAIAAGKITR